MARGTPDLRKGTIPAAVSGVRDAVYTAVETALMAYQSAGVDAWEVHDAVDATPATRNMVYVSRGDRNLVALAGDTRIYVQLQRRSNGWATQEINLSLYQYWDAATNTGYNGTAYKYGQTTLLSSNGSSYVNDTDAVAWWAAGNEYEFIFILKQAGVFGWIQFGQPDRAFVSPAYSGVAFTSGAETAGTGVVIDIDRDLTGLVTDGQKIWIVDAQGGTGDVEITTMTTFTAGTPDTVTMDLVNDYTAGAIIGWDPCPMILSGDPSGGTASSKSWYTCLDASATGTGITVVTSNTTSTPGTWFMNDYGLMIPGSQWDEQYQDPSPLSDLYMGTKVMFNQYDNAANPNQGEFPRGVSDIISYWAHGTQLDEDVMQANNDANQSWRVFPSLPTDSGTILGIGGGTIIP
jgi:hypothetical protein